MTNALYKPRSIEEKQKKDEESLKQLHLNFALQLEDMVDSIQ